MDKLHYYEGMLKFAQERRKVARRNLLRYQQHGFTASILAMYQSEYDRACYEVTRCENIIAEIKG
jgi:hypothetical protein